MKSAEIFRHGIDWYVEYYNDGVHMKHCGEFFSGFNENPLKDAIKMAKNFWGCKSICIIFEKE